MQKKAETGDSCSGTNGFLISSLWFFDTRRETQFLKVFCNHTMLTPYYLTPMFGMSHGVLVLNSSLLVGIRKNLTAAATVENSAQWQRTQFSAPIAEAQMSACMVQSQILISLFFQNLKFSAHLYWA